MSDDERLAGIEQRSAFRSPGRWWWSGPHLPGERDSLWNEYGTDGNPDGEGLSSEIMTAVEVMIRISEHDADFIEHAPDDILWLIDQLKAAQARIAWLELELEQLKTHDPS